jgi:hypothetical protein
VQFIIPYSIYLAYIEALFEKYAITFSSGKESFFYINAYENV